VTGNDKALTVVTPGRGLQIIQAIVHSIRGESIGVSRQAGRIHTKPQSKTGDLNGFESYAARKSRPLWPPRCIAIDGIRHRGSGGGHINGDIPR